MRATPTTWARWPQNQVQITVAAMPIPSGTQVSVMPRALANVDRSSQTEASMAAAMMIRKPCRQSSRVPTMMMPRPTPTPIATGRLRPALDFLSGPPDGIIRRDVGYGGSLRFGGVHRVRH